MTRNQDQGSAIIVVVVFIMVVLIMISTLILFNQFRTQSLLSYGHQLQTYYNTKSIISLVMEDYLKRLHNEDYSPQSYSLSLFGNDSTRISIEPWGFFLRGQCESRIKKTITKRSFLFGSKQYSEFRYALNLGDIKNPLVVAGNTSITGDAAVGIMGIKAGTLAGKPYKGSQTVYGNVYRNKESVFPLINTDMIKYQRQQLKQINKSLTSPLLYTGSERIYLNNQVYSLSQEQLQNLKTNGLNEIVGPGVILLTSNIELDYIRLLNQITLFSDSTIAIKDSVEAEHILVFADSISIFGAAVLKGQFIASNGMTIGNGAQLLYPSIAALLLPNNIASEKEFIVGDDVLIEGEVILAQYPGIFQAQANYKLTIEPTALIKGIAYSDGFMDLRGKVEGSVLANSFYFYHSPTIYINWLYDAEINLPALSRKFVHPLLLKQPSELSILQEL